MYIVICFLKIKPLIKFLFILLVMADYQPGEELKERIGELFGSDSKVNKIIWELLPNYFKIKLPELEIISVQLKTNETGN